MAKYKFKYLEFRVKPFNLGEIVAQIDVSHLNKKGINQKWDELEKQFPKDKYQSCLTECNQERPSFTRNQSKI